MILIKTIEVVLIFCLLYILITQVMVPMFTGRPLFWWFRGNLPQLHDELERTRAANDEANLRAQIDAERALNKASQPHSDQPRKD